MTQPGWLAYEWTETDWLFSGVCVSIAVPAEVDSWSLDMPSVVDTERCDFDRLENLAAGAPSVRGETGAAVGLLQIADAVLMLEPYGGIGETDEFMVPLSRRRTIVSYYVGGHGRGTFKWYDDGRVRCAFDHDSPAVRRGTDPDAVLPWMKEVGGFFPLDSETDDPSSVHATAATVALLEHVSGVELTYSLLRESSYLTALVRE